jgi:hypothetical protein
MEIMQERNGDNAGAQRRQCRSATEIMQERNGDNAGAQ